MLTIFIKIQFHGRAVRSANCAMHTFFCCIIGCNRRSDGNNSVNSDCLRCVRAESQRFNRIEIKCAEFKGVISFTRAVIVFTLNGSNAVELIVDGYVLISVCIQTCN